MYKRGQRRINKLWMSEKKNIPSTKYSHDKCWNDIFLLMSLGSKHEYIVKIIFIFALSQESNTFSVACGLKQKMIYLAWLF